jgi:hypothetical protein
VDASVDAAVTVDARTNAVDGDVAADAPPSCASVSTWQALYACGTPSEGDSICALVTVDALDVIVDVSADVAQPARPDVIDCVRAMLLGRCDPGVTDSMVVCAQGI